METLSGDVVNWLRENGATLVGISTVDRFSGAPRGHHPCDFLPKARSVVTFGIALLHQVLHWENHLVNSELVPSQHREEVLQNYFYKQVGYVMVNDMLDRLALRTANSLESQGYLSLFFPATYGLADAYEFIQKRIPSGWGLFSQRHAAVMAGLGEFGLNNVVVTPQHGPRIRFNSVITEAELTPNPFLKDKVCLGESCSICVESCPGAISLRPDFDSSAVWYNTPARTDMSACRNYWNSHYCWGRCIRVCPVAMKQSTHSKMR